MNPDQELSWLRAALGAAQHRIAQLEGKIVAADWLADAASAYLEIDGSEHSSMRAALDAYRESP